jgi:hypothetical protein
VQAQFADLSGKAFSFLSATVQTLGEQYKEVTCEYMLYV